MESNEAVIFYQGDFLSTSFAAFESMRKTEELCDVTIKVQDCSLPAHRVILVVRIPYFRAVFEERVGEADISVYDMEPVVLQSLIDFAYSGKVEISIENVRSLLMASKFLQLHEVLDACVEFLSKTFHFNNIVNVCVLSRSLNNQKLIESSKRFIQDNFADFSQTDDFVNLPHLCFKEVIAEDDLNAPNEKTVLEAVLKWVKHSPFERRVLLPDLLAEVRLTQLPIEYLTEMGISDHLISSSVPCRELIGEIKNYHLLKSGCALNLKTQPRKCSSIKDGVYAICQSGFLEHSIYFRDFIKEEWHVVSKIHTHADSNTLIYNAAAVNGKIYIFFSETILALDPKTLGSELLAAIHKGISGSSIVACGDLIYCCGSYDDEFKTSVRRFDTWENKWLNEIIMRTPVCTAAATSLGESIFVTGGYNRGACLDAVEKYNPLTGEWKSVASMLTARRRHGCATLREKIYVCGGGNSGIDLHIAEVYKPLTNQWNYISPMKLKRNSFSFVPYKGKLYALNGGILNSRYNLESEIYDPENDEWKSCFCVPMRYKIGVAITIPGN